MDLDASVETVFAFHADPNNIPLISPGWQHVEIRHATVSPAAGEPFEIVVRFFGWLPLRWRGVWVEVKSPVLLVDEATQSPFAYWRHRHEFAALGERRTRMTDHVSFLFPGGWAGKWLAETFGRVQFRLMFADRHARTRRWMREHS